MEVRASAVIGTFIAEEMDVTHLDLLDTIHLCLVIVFARWVDALAGTVAGDDFLPINRLIQWRNFGDRRGRGSCFGCPAVRDRLDGCREAIGRQGRGRRGTWEVAGH